MSNQLVMLKKYCKTDSVQERMNEMLGKRKDSFLNSIINVVSSNKMLSNCSPDSIMKSAMISASMNLPIDPTLGYSAIVPYGKEAQYQIMYKGLIQLCIRSGQYKDMNASKVYKDELKSYNPITGKAVFNEVENFKDRYSDNGEVVGYYAFFELATGFKKELYFSKKEIQAHGKKYSKSYSSKYSAWTTDFDAMGIKTVLKALLSKYGIMSLEMQDAFVSDSKADFDDSSFSKNDELKNEKQGSTVIDVEAVPVDEDLPEEKQETKKVETEKETVGETPF